MHVSRICAWGTSRLAFDGSGTLPQEIDVPEYFLEKKNFEVDGEYSRDEMLDQLSDWLSDEYGFCHGGFDVE